MLLEEDVVMNVEDSRLPPQQPLPEQERECRTTNEPTTNEPATDEPLPWPLSPPPAPWPRVFPGL
jgi:hypothetical protein